MQQQQNQLDIVKARSVAMRAPINFSPHLQNETYGPSLDPFWSETTSFFLPTTTPTALSSAKPIHQTLLPKTHSSVLNSAAPSSPSSNPKIHKPNKRQKRFVTNWTPQMDKIVRKSLAKFGWGCWSRIASCGKLPKQYTAKMIANRAKSIGLTKDMFGPSVASTRTTKPPNR